MRLNYSTSTTIHLSLEDYHNAGMTPEKSKEIIEGINDVGSGGWPNKLSCTKQFINRNWNVRTNAYEDWEIEELVYQIQSALNAAIERGDLTIKEKAS